MRERMTLKQSVLIVSAELGKVSRNCTEFGWSETFPHYVDACLSEEGNGSHVVSVEWRQILGVTDMLHVRHMLSFVFWGCRTCTTCRWRPCTRWVTAPLWSHSPSPWSSYAGSGEIKDMWLMPGNNLSRDHTRRFFSTSCHTWIFLSTYIFLIKLIKHLTHFKLL